MKERGESERERERGVDDEGRTYWIHNDVLELGRDQNYV